MSFDPDDPEECPTCQVRFRDEDDTADRCDHRRSYAPHLAFRLGMLAFEIPTANREEPDRTNPHPDRSDEACWWSRGFSYAARGHYMIADEMKLAKALTTIKRLRAAARKRR